MQNSCPSPAVLVASRRRVQFTAACASRRRVQKAARASRWRVPWLCVLLFAVSSPSWALGSPTIATIIKNGPDTQKKVLVFIGDGFAKADLPDYRARVDSLVADAFANDDVLRGHYSAFNIYRIDAESNDSGVSRRVYVPDATVPNAKGCSSDDNADDALDTSCTATTTPPCYTHDTAFDFVYTGCWGRCWLEKSPNTDADLKAVLDDLVPKRDYVVRILHVLEGNGGGCGGNGSLTITDHSPWTTLVHEMGHMVVNLHDEYGGQGEYEDGAFNSKNCTTKKKKSKIAWSALLTPGIKIPTTWDSATMDADETVGLFKGCYTYDSRIFRPVYDCRMKGNVNQFCPVCSGILSNTLANFDDDLGDYRFYANYPGISCKPTSTSAVAYTGKGGVENPSANPASLFCPTRRVRQGDSFTNRLFGEIFARDQNPTTDVCCRVVAQQPGGTRTPGPYVCTTGASSSRQRIKLLYPKLYHAATFAHFGIECELPAIAGSNESELYTYRIGQQYY